MHAVIVAIDGPAASGKSTLARQLAQRHGWAYINTGQMYRAVAHFGRLAQLSLPADEAKAIQIAHLLHFTISQNTLLVNGDNLSDKTADPEVERLVSTYAAIPDIRQILVNKQRAIAKTQSVVMDGRDIGTVVFPDATLKIFLVAKPEIRAKRRFDEILSRFHENLPSYDEILRDITLRDAKDCERALSPLAKADDAILVDTSTLSSSETLERIDALLNRVLS